MLSVKQLSKHYGKFSALRDVSFQLEDGHTLLLLGPNGAGKTTAIRCIMGLLNYDGEIKLDGLDAKAEGVELRRQIGYVPQQSSYYENLGILDQARLMGRIKKASEEELKEKLELVGLWTLHKRQVKSLSSGMKQRLGIAIALLNDPPLLIFDEPTSNVDFGGQLEFQSLLQRFRREGKTMIITTHVTGLDRYSDEVLVLEAGQVVANGAPEELLAKVSANDTVLLRVHETQVPEARKLLDENGFGTVRTRDDEWLVLSVSATDKAKMLSMLVSHGLVISDIIIRPRDIESEYLELMRGTKN